MELITIYARKEPTRDSVAIAHGLKGKRDTVFYQDAACTKFFMRKPWYQSGHPTRRTKTVTLNCFPWALQWAK